MTRFRYDRNAGTAVYHQHKREETRRTWKPGPQDPLSIKTTDYLLTVCIVHVRMYFHIL